MAAFQVSPDGHVIPPLNITQPAPFMNLPGFQWGTVSDDIRISPNNPHGDVDPSQLEPTENEQFSTEQAGLVADAPSFRRAPGDTASSVETAPAPQIAVAAPPQLAEQLKLGEKPQSGVGPLFPLDKFQGPYAGNGFNTIFRPRKFQNIFPPKKGPFETFVDFGKETVTGSEGVADNILQLSLTLEQLILELHRGRNPIAASGNKKDINLFGVPYLQTVKDVTNPSSGLGNNPQQVDIHFEPGVWLNVPPADFQDGKFSIVRMASIPHGTTINAQGFSPPKNPKTVTGGELGPPNFDLPENQVDARPFNIGKPDSRDSLEKNFPNLNADSKGTFRIPQDLKKLASSGKITSALLRNPNLYLKKAIEKLKITETITFEVHTGPGPPEQTLNGGGTANIAFLAGNQDPITTNAPSGPGVNAHAISMKARYWIERVIYKVAISQPLKPHEEMKIAVFAQIPADSTAPTPSFIVKASSKAVPENAVIDVPGTQIQCSQLVILNFGGLSWPHVSVSTLVPKEPQRFTIPE